MKAYVVMGVVIYDGEYLDSVWSDLDSALIRKGILEKGGDYDYCEVVEKELDKV